MLAGVGGAQGCFSPTWAAGGQRVPVSAPLPNSMLPPTARQALPLFSTASCPVTLTFLSL